jgi:hypothetical protein
MAVVLLRARRRNQKLEFHSDRLLAKDIYGIGFKTADQIAQNVGIPKDSLNRASAGIDHVLLEATTEGHCAWPVVQLTASAVKLLEVGEGTVEQALSQMITSGSLLLEVIRGESLVFLPHLRKAEEGIAVKIRALVEAPPAIPAHRFRKGGAVVRGKDGEDTGSQSEGRPPDGAHRPGSDHYGWSRRGQDDPGEFDPDDSPGQGREMPAVCAHWQGGEAAL